MNRLRRRWRGVGVSLLLAGLTANAWWQAGWVPVLILAGTGLGLAAVVVMVGGATGYLVVAESKQRARAIEAAHGPRKELTR